MRFAIVSALNYFPKLKRALKKLRNRLFPGARVSSDYFNLCAEDAEIEGRRLRNAWQNEALPHRQRMLAEQQLHKFRSGSRVDEFDVFVDSLRFLPNNLQDFTLLEVGCSSGFYSEVIKISRLPIKYSGCDYSEAFIRLARDIYPSVDFAVADATDLHYADCNFDIVVSGCCLLHIPEYAKGVEEVARVTRHYAIFHRTPVVWGQPNQWYRKNAYGIETVEIHFNEEAFLALLALNSLELIATYTLSGGSAGVEQMQGQANRTYVCKKKS